jgi:hypothetical protein
MLELCYMYFHLLRASVEGVKHVTQNNIQYSRQLSIHKITKKKIDNILFPINPLNVELNPTCHLLALLGAHHNLHVSKIRVKTQKRVEPIVDDSVLKTTSHTKP